MLKYSILFLFTLFFSCSNGNKIEKKTSNNFLAYYNTYYNAKVKFEDALNLFYKDDN